MPSLLDKMGDTERESVNLTESTPNISALWRNANHSAKVLGGLLELLLAPANGGNLGQGDDRVGVVTKCRLVGSDGAVEIS